MKAIELQSPNSFRHIEIAEPSRPGPDEALVRTHVMGICGTDVSCYLGKFPFFDYPRIPGHELGVEVLEVGEQVSNVSAGDMCSVEPYINCRECHACRLGFSNCCANLKVVGVMMNGGLCDQFLIRAEKLHPSNQLDYSQLALVETLAIGCRATNRGAPDENEHVLIIGAGPIGLATLEFTRLTNAQITVMDLSEQRLDFCRENYGVHNTIQFENLDSAIKQARAITDGSLFQCVTDATGSQQSMSQSLEYVAPTGTLVFVGITTETLAFPHPKMHRPEMTIKASRNALPDDFRRIIKLIESGTINTTPWITHRTSFDAMIDDFPMLILPESNVIKAVIDVQ